MFKLVNAMRYLSLTLARNTKEEIDRIFSWQTIAFWFVWKRQAWMVYSEISMV